MKLLGRYDGMFDATSKAPSNAKYAVLINQHLNDLLYTAKIPEQGEHGCMIAETCEGQRFIIGPALPFLIIELPAGFSRIEETPNGDESPSITPENSDTAGSAMFSSKWTE